MSVTVLLLTRDILTWCESQFELIITCVIENWKRQIVVGIKRGFWVGPFVPGQRGYRTELSTDIWALPTSYSSILKSLRNAGVMDVDVICG